MYDGRARRGSTDIDREWVLGIGLGNPLVPDEWKIWDTDVGGIWVLGSSDLILEGLSPIEIE
jgi:hypothetical protein